MKIKNVSIFLRIGIPVALIALTGVLTYLINTHLQYKVVLDDRAVNVVERNVSLVNEILLNAEKIFTNEKESKENIQRAENIFDFSLSALKNGGIPPGYDDKMYIPFPGELISEHVIELEKYWYAFKQPMKVILTEPAFSVIKTPKDTIINGHYQSVMVVERSKNLNVLAAKEKLNTGSQVLVQKSDKLSLAYKSRIEDYKFLGKLIFVIAIIIVILLSGYILLVLKKHILDNVKIAAHEIKNLAQSDNVKSTNYKFNDELRPFFDNLEQLKNKSEDLTEFIQALGKGEYDARLKHYNRNSRLDVGLVELRDKLYEGEQKAIISRKEEEKRAWATQGQTKFNEILRNAATNVQELADAVIKNLVGFINAAQGGVFLKVEDENGAYLELLSAFAYDRKKFFTKRIEIGNGLVGMVALEKNTIWLDKIPDNYMEVESGLGEAAPKSLLIVPLKTEADLLGVIEIASLNALTKEQVEFVENLAHNIASTIQSAKINEQTAELLNESQKKSEELAARDAEMRQTIKELQKAQAEADRNESEMSALIMALDQAMLSAEFTVRQKIVSANRQFLTKSDYHFDEIDGKPFFSLFKEAELKPEEILEKVKAGETIQLTQQLISKYKTEYWISAQYTPVKDTKGKITKILFLGNDITHRVEIEKKNAKLLEETLEKAEQLSVQEKEMRTNLMELMETQQEIRDKEFEVRALLSAVDINLIKAEFSETGQLLTANRKFIETFKCDETAVKELNVSDFFNEDVLAGFKTIWEDLFKKDKVFQSQIELTDKNNNPLWLTASFTPVKNVNGVTSKIVFLANDISELKKAELKIRAQSEVLKQQEELMVQNMEEIMHEQEELTAELEKYINIESELSKKFETQSDKIHKKWLDSLSL